MEEDWSMHKVVGDERKIGEESPPRLQTPPIDTSPPLNTFLSPSENPPSRVQSSNSLLGEDYVNSGRTPEDNILGSYSDDDHTTPPSIHSGLPQSSPPALHPQHHQPGTFLNSPITSVHSYPTRSAKKGRPPLVPVAFTSSTKAQATQANHTRGHSTGEFSFMSALTDPLGDDDTKLQQRGVSWDANFFDTSVDDDQQTRPQEPFSILQPILSDEPPRSINTSPAQSSSRVEERLAMTDIVSPIESEAESAIMKALEDRERHMVGPTGGPILPNLTDEAVASFQEHAIEQQQRGEASMPPSHPSRESVRSLNSQKSAGNPNTQQGEAAYDKTKHHRRTNTMATFGSVEDTLYNLATIMRNIHKNEDHGAEEMDQGHVMASYDIGHPVATMFDEAPMTQSDALANHAALLFRGQMKEPEAAVVNTSNEETDPKKNDDIILEDESEPSSNKEQDIELGIAASDNGGSGSPGSKRVRRSMAKIFCCRAMNDANGDWDTFDNFLVDHKKSLVTYSKSMLLWLFLPATSVAAVLYYGLGNPSMSSGYDPDTQLYPSISWFILFLCVRQVITFSLAKVTEIFLIDFLALKTRFLLRLLGPLLSLLVVQSKGWPCTVFFWAVYDLSMLSGTGGFANHWVFYQNVVGLFNADNPSGGITSDIWNYRILIVALVLGIIVAVKRFVVGLYLGGRQYCKYFILVLSYARIVPSLTFHSATYGSKLAVVIHKMIVISQVAGLARQMEREVNGGLSKSKGAAREDMFNWNFRGFGDAMLYEENESDSAATRTGELDNDIKDPYTRRLRTSDRIKITQLLDQWEEPPEERGVVSGIILVLKPSILSLTSMSCFAGKCLN